MGDDKRGRIEAATEEVTLRDLAHTGLSKVQVMRSSDIERMIDQAVAEVVVAGEQNRGRLEKRTRAALGSLMKGARQLIEKAQAVEVTIQSHSATNARLAAENRVLAEKARGLTFCVTELSEANTELSEKVEQLAAATEQVKERVCALQFRNRDRRRALVRERKSLPDVESHQRERDRLVLKLAEIEEAFARDERRVAELAVEPVFEGPSHLEGASFDDIACFEEVLV